MDHRIEPTLSPLPDTIAAVSTPPGEGGIGVVRLSGPTAISIACRLFRRANGKSLTDPRPYRLYYGTIVDPESADVVDEVLLSVMRAPRSYTREDVVEISGHGGPVSLRAILAPELRRRGTPGGAGRIHPARFPERRIDLTQAEAVLDTIRARSDAGLRSAQQVLHGALGGRVRLLRDRLVALLASLEAAIDYAEEDITLLTRQRSPRNWPAPARRWRRC